MRDGDKQLSPIRNEETGPRAGSSLNLLDSRVVIRVLLIEDIHESPAANHIHPASGRVVKQIVCIVDDLERPGLPPGFGVNYEQPRRRPASDQQAMASFVES